MLQQNQDHILLRIKVTPNSSRTKISGKFIDEKNQKYLKINVAAAPTDGKANDELIKFFAKSLKISKSKIEILHGETSRIKIIKIHSTTQLSMPTIFAA